MLIMKTLKQHEYKSGTKVLFDYAGKTHEGIIEIEGKQIFNCQNVYDGSGCKNKHGKKYSYALCHFDGSDFLGKDYDELKNIRLKPTKKYDHDKVKVNEKECVSAKTEEEAEKVVDKLIELGGCWRHRYFKVFGASTVYHPQLDTYDSVANRTFIPAKKGIENASVFVYTKSAQKNAEMFGGTVEEIKPS